MRSTMLSGFVVSVLGVCLALPACGKKEATAEAAPAGNAAGTSSVAPSDKPADKPSDMVGKPSDAPPAASDTAAIIQAMEDAKTAVCACADVDCAKKVMQDFSMKMAPLAKQIGDKPPEELITKSGQMQKEIGTCMQKLMGGTGAPAGGEAPPAGAAGGAPAAAAPGVTSGFVSGMSELADKVCACADMACATTLTNDFGQKAGTLGTPNADEMGKVDEISKKLRDCMTTLAQKVTP